ncbi:unnamed protein product, partial [Meganyctiphanes norvegica]
MFDTRVLGKSEIMTSQVIKFTVVCENQTQSSLLLPSQSALLSRQRLRLGVTSAPIPHTHVGPPPPPRYATANCHSLIREYMNFTIKMAYIIFKQRKPRISGKIETLLSSVPNQDKDITWFTWEKGEYTSKNDEIKCNYWTKNQEEDLQPIMGAFAGVMVKTLAGNCTRVRSLLGSGRWMGFARFFAQSGIVLVAEEQNLIDLIRPEDSRPASENITIYPLELMFAGKTWQEKVSEIRSELKKLKADVLVITTLEEAAWLLNLRSKGGSFTPVFDSFVIVTDEQVELYLKINNTSDIENHLNVHGCHQNPCVILKDYGTIYDRLRNLKDDQTVKKVLLSKKRTYGPGASYAIYNAVPASKRLVEVSPALTLKGQKNPIEIMGMKNSHIRDAVALCDFLAFLEKDIKSGAEWDELSAANLLRDYRAQQEHFVSLSFGPISSFGKNGALNHYNPTIETTQKITNESTYLLDSGGQYKDGTTDVTRTMHYGTPTAYQIETYTRVLMGAIDLARVVFPEGVGDDDVDILTRQHLYAVGLDYHHGTGHGIGMFLNVHEDPILIGNSARDNHEFKVGHFFSDEPGYYKDGDFGIRLETILHVVEKKVPYFFKKKTLGFESVTLVPFEAKLINSTLLEPKQCRYLNDYHQQVLTIVGAEMQKQGRVQGYQWVLEKTKHIDCN